MRPINNQTIGLSRLGSNLHCPRQLRHISAAQYPCYWVIQNVHKIAQCSFFALCVKARRCTHLVWYPQRNVETREDRQAPIFLKNLYENMLRRFTGRMKLLQCSIGNVYHQKSHMTKVNRVRAQSCACLFSFGHPSDAFCLFVCIES
jgi:hypothetical protein